MIWTLITSEFPPRLGGIAEYYAQVVANWPENKIVQKIFSTEISWWRQWPEYQATFNQSENVILGEILPHGIALAVWNLLHCFQPLKYGIWFHGLDLIKSQSTWRRRFLASYLVSRAKIILVNSQATAELFRHFFPKASVSIAVAHPLLPPSFKTINLPEIKAEPIRNYLFIGRLVKRKGLEDILSAWPKVLAKYPDSTLTIIGIGDEIRAANYSNLKQIIWLGAVEEKTKKELLLASQALIFAPIASDDDIEGFGIVLLEAAWAGLKIFTRLSGGTAEAVKASAITVLPPGNIAEAWLSGIEEHEKDLSIDLSIAKKALTEQQAYVLKYFSSAKEAWKAADKILNAAFDNPAQMSTE